MKYNPEIHHRASMRYPGYDYSLPGHYFITMCIQNRECILGNIIKGKMQLSNIGKITLEKWHEIPIHYNNVKLDAFIVMPNHIHGIIEILDDSRRLKCPMYANVGAQHLVPIPQDYHLNADYHLNKFQGVVSGSLGSIIRGYKIGITKEIKILTGNSEYGSIWQRNYYDSIIETDEHLFAARNYIRNNPSKWISDLHNPDKQ